jgi:hypothetical protein
MAVFLFIPPGDLELDRGSYVIVDGATYIRQRIAARFKWWLGEWFRDQRLGVPYQRDVFVKNPNIQLIRSMFRRLIEQTPGVLRCDRIDVRYLESERKLEVEFAATLVENATVIVDFGDSDFILDLAA